MNRTLSLRNLIYYILYYSQWPAGAVAAMLTVLATKDPIKYTQPYIKSSIVMSKQYAALSIVLAVYVGLANYASKKIGPPWAWQSIKYIIDRFQKQIIKGSSHPKYDEHRVTLFKCVRWNFRMTDWKTLKERSGSDKYPNLKQLWNLRWFKPLTRSGPTTQRLRTWFPLYEEGTIGEGVIGEVWRTEGVKRVEDLPEIPPIDEADAAQVYKTYAAEVKCNEKWLRSRNNRTMARSYCGIPIEVDNGKRWGVIIIDSREPRLNISNEQIELAAVALGKFIEKA